MYMKDNKPNVSVIEMSTYTSPEVTENQRQGVMTWEDQDGNDYFQYLTDRYEGSPTNNAIIKGVAQQIYGRGLAATDADRNVEAWVWLKTKLKARDMKRAAHDLKMFGKVALQVTWAKDKKSIYSISHVPVDKVRVVALGDGETEISKFKIAFDWDKVLQNKEEAQSIDIYNPEKRVGSQLIWFDNYATGSFYYAPVDYQGSLHYAQLEEEIANYHISHVQNGMSPSMLVNFNNGVPSEQERNMVERDLKRKFGGTSAAGSIVVSFNDDAETAATVEAMHLPDAHSQYEFLSKECEQKLCTGHRITSPLLLGIKSASGFSSNAEEMETAFQLLDNVTIRPYQDILIELVDELLASQGYSLDLYFKTLKPIDFTEGVVKDADTIEKETGIKMSKQDSRPFLKDELAEKLVANLEGLGSDEEDLLEEYDMVSEEEVLDVDTEPSEQELNDMLCSVYMAAKDDSEMDGDRYKVRYVYALGEKKKPSTGESRPLCTALMKSNKVYTREDIEAMSSKGGAEDGGQQYNVFLYKGGVNCYHIWTRKVYRKKLKEDGTPYGGNALTGAKAVSVNQAIREGAKFEKQPKEVAQAPINMPKNGAK